VGQWLQDVGLYAFLWLLLVALAYGVVPEFRQRSAWGWLHNAMTAGALAAVVLFLVFLILLLFQGRVPDLNAPKSTDPLLANAPPPMTYTPAQKICLALAGLVALLACALPLFRDLFQKRIIFRRIWAIARVSIKEAWSRGIVWVCLIIPLLYLYADWYISVKPEDQLRNRVSIAYFALTVLFVLTGALLGAFSIPADIRSQNIFTIVTKPIERYEIVLGRFLGYALLLFVELMVLTGISYIYVRRGLTERAKEESYHARVPLFGRELYYHNTGKRHEGENVGREWNYRSYITGINPQSPNQRVQYAIWAFDALPAALATREEPVRLEFSFDIFRTTTGQENKDVYCTFTFAKGSLSPDQVENLLKPTGLLSTEYNALYTAHLKVAAGKSSEERDRLNAEAKKEIRLQLFRKHGVYQIQGVGVTDYHTQFEDVPAAIFKTLLESAPEPGQVDSEGRLVPVMQVFVNVENDRFSRLQLVGMAKADLYLLVGDRPFWINFFKGALCIYLIACIVLGLAVVCSTYLSGIISLLVTQLLILGGLFLPFIKSLAEGRSEGGGPLESMYRLANRQSGGIPLDKQSATIDVLFKGDAVYQWWLRFIMNVIPDVSQYYPKDYVANGFDITWGTLLFLNNIVPVVGYLTPWLILAYFLMKSREIANP
jgi:hypothetical protein